MSATATSRPAKRPEVKAARCFSLTRPHPRRPKFRELMFAEYSRGRTGSKTRRFQYPLSAARVRPQSRRVGRAVLCAPGRDYGHAAACRGLPALPPPAITEALPARAKLCCLSRGGCDYTVRRMWIVRLALRRPYTFVVASL